MTERPEALEQVDRYFLAARIARQDEVVAELVDVLEGMRRIVASYSEASDRCR